MPCPYETLSEQTIDEVMEKLKYKFILQSILPLLLACVYPVASSAQDWFRTGTGLGVEKARVAVPDFAPRTTSSQPVSRIFTEVLRGDLENSGILDMVSPSFFPEQTASIPAELKAASWNAPPASAHLVAYGNLTATGNDLTIEACHSDVRNAATPPVIGKRYHGEVTEAQVRMFA